jgi:glycosyltransferase involved in cell wall biosynthesis
VWPTAKSGRWWRAGIFSKGDKKNVMSGFPAVSVVLPVYNRRELVGRAIHSVLEQSCVDWELIAIDDASDDGTPELIAGEFGDRVRLLVQEQNRGVSAARNRGIEAAIGEWVAFLDSDDEWLPEKLERQLNELRRTGLEVCHTDEIWVRNGVRVNPPDQYRKRGGDLFEQALSVCCMCPSSLLIRRDLLESLGMFDEKLPACEDYELFLRLTARRRVAYVDETLVVKYGGHPDQLSRAFFAMDRFRVYGLDRLLCEVEDLEEGRREAAREVLLRKARIVRNGAHKRENSELEREMGIYIDRWE